MRLNIDLGGLGADFGDIMNDPFLREAFKDSSNKIIDDSLQESFRAIENKWNINIVPEGETKFTVEGVDGSRGSRDGKLRIQKATTASGTFIIHPKGSAINFSRFVFNLSGYLNTSTRLRSRKSRVENRSPFVKILRNSPPRQYKGTFVRKMKNGHIGVFSRKKDSRLKIAERRQITLPSMLDQVGFEGILGKNWNEKIDILMLKHLESGL